MSDIEKNLSRIDLNLLVPLSVLLQEKNVSRAAERLFLSQSAMSRTLQRLRDVFEDPLFNRSARGIIPTVKALELEKKLPNILYQLNNFLEVKHFIPETSSSSFSISVPPLMSHALILPFIKKVADLAPNICISEYAARIDPYKPLSLGVFDFAIHIQKPKDNDFIATHITKMTPTIYARKGHPVTKEKGDQLTNCLKYNFAELIIEDAINKQFQNPIDVFLAEHNISRNVTSKSNQLSILIQMLLTQDLLLIAPDLLGKKNDISEILEPVYQFEIKAEDVLDLYLLSHKRIEKSASHQWLKQQLLSVF